MKLFATLFILSQVIGGCGQLSNSKIENSNSTLNQLEERNSVQPELELTRINYVDLEIGGFPISRNIGYVSKNSVHLDSIGDIHVDGMEQMEQVYYFGKDRIYYSKSMDRIVGFDLLDNKLSINIDAFRIGNGCEPLIKYTSNSCQIETLKRTIKHIFIPIWEDNRQLDAGLDIDLDNDTIVKIGFSWKM